MPTLTLNGIKFVSQTDESVLDTLLRENIQIPHGCRQGVCHACMIQSLDNPPPTYAQLTLKPAQQQKNYFLACICHPQQDMSIALPNHQNEFLEATVVQKQMLSADVMRIVLQCHEALFFFAGQFVNLRREDGLIRSYSIANLPQANLHLEFHIGRFPNGQFSNWVFDELSIGDTLQVSEPQGKCYYHASHHNSPLLLIGTGTGLAPLLGIIRDALHQSHQAPIHLFHGNRRLQDLYLVEEMRELTQQYPNFHYTPCLSGESADGYAQGRVHEIALTKFENLTGWRVYLCGHPDMINETRRAAYAKGVSLTDIYADAFLASS